MRKSQKIDDNNSKQNKKSETIKIPIIKGVMRLKIDGLNQPRLLSKLLKEKISTKNIKRENSKEMLLDINKKDSKKTFAILQNLCYNYTIVYVSGVSRTFRALFSRVGIAIGLVAFSTILAFSRGFIWKMDINGCDKVSQPVIESLLKSNGIAVGKSLRGVNKTQICQQLNNTVGVVESSVEVRGTTLIVNILESADFTPKPTSQETDIISKYDATITRIVCLGGTSVVARGQKIFKGAPLICAYRLSPDGEKKEQVNASGMVYGNVNITTSATLSTSEYILKQSGKTYSNSILNIFGLKIGKSKNPFKNYTSVKETLYPFLGTFIPLKLERETICETNLQLVEHDIAELAKQTTCEYVLQNIIKCGGTEIQTTTDVKQLSEHLYTLNVNIQAEMPLCI